MGAMTTTRTTPTASITTSVSQGLFYANLNNSSLDIMLKISTFYLKEVLRYELLKINPVWLRVMDFGQVLRI